MYMKTGVASAADAVFFIFTYGYGVGLDAYMRGDLGRAAASVVWWMDRWLRLSLSCAIYRRVRWQCDTVWDHTGYGMMNRKRVCPLSSSGEGLGPHVESVLLSFTDWSVAKCQIAFLQVGRM